MRRFILPAMATALALASCNEAPDQQLAAGPANGNAAATGTAHPGVPEAQAKQVRALGAKIDPAALAIFAPLVKAPPYDDVTIDKDLAYGSDPAQRLDVYTANAAKRDEARPVLLFVHGGGFVRGDKAGDYYPQNITAWAARSGMVGVNIDYRLAPAAPWPAGRDDLARAIGWVEDNIARYGGDPKRIILWGHSAGANHVADYVQHTELQGAEAGGVKGALLLSPAYFAPGDTPHAYYGKDADLASPDKAIERLGKSAIPVMLAYSEYDPQGFHDFAGAVDKQLCGSGHGELKCPRIVYLKDHDHLTEGASVGSVDQSLTGPLLEWIRGL